MNKLVFIAAFVLIAVSPVITQQDEKISQRKEAEDLLRQVVGLYQSGKYNEALPLAEKALVLSENATGNTSDLTATALFNLAEVQLSKKKYKEFEATYDRYLAIHEKPGGVNDPKLTSSLERYVCTLIGLNRRSKALEIQKKIFKLDNKFDFADTGKPLTKNMEMAGLSSGSGDKLPQPTYLPEAKMAGVSGSVVYRVNTDEAGTVIGVTPLCGHPLLIKGSEPALQKSKFKPTIVAGKPVKVTFLAIYNFVL